MTASQACRLILSCAVGLHRCPLAVSGGALLDASWGRQPRPVVSGGARPDISWDLAAVAAGVATIVLSRWCAAAAVAAAIAAIAAAPFCW